MMLLSDIVRLIPNDELLAIEEYVAKLKEVCPLDENGNEIDWLAIRIEDWWREKKYKLKYGYHIPLTEKK